MKQTETFEKLRSKMIGAVQAPRKPKAFKPMRFTIYEDPQDQSSMTVTPIIKKIDIKEVHINIYNQRILSNGRMA